MVSKITYTLAALCLVHVLVESSFIKPNNVPRVGRSNEADGPFDQNMMGYVIKTIPSKNIPRMGRRNYDSANHYDIPKLYQVPSDNAESYSDEDVAKMNQELDEYFGNH
ncbi:unnamed protein product [Euphydryas editha]|uniref:Uncharacterized protein n=1 Tax=Euphydryas editha TaxID=104508 RepID=A0AAU9TAM7_EUPED|nr:unnamed protein product [Euphydryas editha]